MVFSKKLRHLMAGSEKVDSIAWNPHKMVGAPLQTSAFIVRHKGLLHTTNSANATYLFQQVETFILFRYVTFEGLVTFNIDTQIKWEKKGRRGANTIVISARIQHFVHIT